jgi:hypothetical protein
MIININMKKLIIISLILISVSFNSCEFLQTDGNELTTEEVIEGLKTALIVGTDTSVVKTSAEDGYYGDPLLKILLPQEADVIIDNLDNPIFSTLGLTDLIEEKLDEVVLAINRAAEDAASDAGPIFRDAITSLTISDAWDILNGINPASNKKETGFDSTAATAFLRSTTYDALVAAFSPYIDVALDKDISVLGFSANDAWNTLTSYYNRGANSPLDIFDNLKPVNTDIGEYTVGKALDGLFLKVGEEEIKIRHDPWAWASETVGKILTKVFGQKN